MEEKKDSLEIIIVNNNYEKMSRRKKTISDSNENAIKTNEHIEKAKKTNTVLTLLACIAISAAFCAFIWFFIQDVTFFGVSSTLISKIILFAVAIVCVFIIGENLSSIYKSGLDKNKKSVLVVGEGITFTNFIHNKTPKNFRVTAYEDIPYEAQKVYFTLYLEDKDGKQSEYTGLEKWSLVLLPMLFDAVIDAENATIYLPYENESAQNIIRNKIKDHVAEEEIAIERAAKDKAERQLILALTEKEATERVLIKNSEEVTKLREELAEANRKIEIGDTSYNKEKSELLATIEANQKEKSELSEMLIVVRNSLSEKEKAEAQLNANVQSLESKLQSSQNEAAQHQNTIKTLEDKVAQTARELEDIKSSSNAEIDRNKNTIKALEDEIAKTKQELSVAVASTGASAVIPDVLVAAKSESNVPSRNLDDEFRELQNKYNVLVTFNEKNTTDEKAKYAFNRMEKERARKEKALQDLKAEKSKNIELSAKIIELEDTIKNNAAAQEAPVKTVVVNEMSDEMRKDHEEKISFLERQNKAIADQCESKIASIKKQHEGEIESLKDAFATAAKEAKDALDKRHREEIEALKAENARLISENNIEDINRELSDVKDTLKKESAARTAREKELEFEREKIKTLETKIKENDAKMAEKVQEVVAEKDQLQNSLDEATKSLTKLKQEKESVIAAAGVQERALLKDKTALDAKIKTLEDQLRAVKDFSIIKEENEKLKNEVSALKREDIESVKRDCDERVSLMKEENAKMEKKMREAIEAAAKEKAERIKGEETLRKYLSDQERAEYEKKIAAQEAEIAKARERAEKAQQDALRAQENASGGEEKKRPARRLNY